MIKVNQIRDAINRLLVDKLGAKNVYINRCPKNFKRPSFWLETVCFNSEPSSYSTVKVEAHFSITCFISTDAYGNSDSTELTDMQESVMSLFRAGYMKVDDRALTVKANAAGYDNDRSYVDVQFEFYDERLEKAEAIPLMSSLNVNLKEGS